MFRRQFCTSVKTLTETVTKPGSSTAWVKETQEKPRIHSLMSETFQALRENSISSSDEPAVNIHSKFVPHFDQGDNYDPFDFNVATAQFTNYRVKFPKTFKVKPENYKQRDTFQKQGINPLDLYCSPYALSKFLTPGGKILSRKQTGLSQKNHNLVAKAIRRARAIGFLSSVHQDIRFVPSNGS